MMDAVQVYELDNSNDFPNSNNNDQNNFEINTEENGQNDDVVNTNEEQENEEDEHSYASRPRTRSRSPRETRRSPNNNNSRNNNNKRRSNQQNNRSSNNRRDNLPTSRELRLKYNWENTVFVSNIAFDVKWGELKDLFKRVGEIQYCEIFERNGRSYGQGSVEFKNSKDAQRAIDELDGHRLLTREIKVRLDPDGLNTRRAKDICRAATTQQKNDSPSSGGQHKPQQQQRVSSSANNNNNLSSASLVSQQIVGQLNQVLSSPAIASLLGIQPTNIGQQPLATNMTLLNQLAEQLKIEGPVTNKIFVANLDFKVDERKIREVFALAGAVQHVTFFKDRATGKSRGIVLVEFETGLDALNAISMFDQQLLNDRKMNVRFDTKPGEESSSPQSKLPSGLATIGNRVDPLALLQQQQQLQQPQQQSFLQTQQQPNALEALTALTASLSQANIPNFNPNYSLIQQQQQQQQPLIQQQQQQLPNNTNYLGYMQGMTNMQQQPQQQYQQPQQYQQQQNQQQNYSRSNNTISKVFIRNVPFSWNEHRLREKFRQAGAIEYCDIKMIDGKSKGHGAVKYFSPQDAERAVELFNNSNMDGRHLEVKLDSFSQQQRY